MYLDADSAKAQSGLWKTPTARPVWEGIPETQTLAGQHERGWQHQLVGVIEGAFPAQRGRFITGYLAASGFVDDPLVFLADYESNRAANDQYLSHLDLHRAIGSDGGDVKVSSDFLVGLALGVASALMIVKLKKSNNLA